MQKDVFLCCLTVSIIHDQVHVCSDLNKKKLNGGMQAAVYKSDYTTLSETISSESSEVNAAVTDCFGNARKKENYAVTRQCLLSFSPSFVIYICNQSLIHMTYTPLQAIYTDALAVVLFMSRGWKFVLLV